MKNNIIENNKITETTKAEFKCDATAADDDDKDTAI